ncbi:MAG: MBL fold metallo-hydrolase [Ignavibacteriaceae bacterium]|nr:MBL fold metallo-hydrolase [Ignavibacterium sp.]MCC6255855.1 MBL fold metallo-hydrolase [Ignavibacteriaceae bacterium]HMN26131.1 MBL fold metallo-hydrolase [Ignavibacteriaceae bacterium]HRN25229.1 MBL fold metallo-hydrolase [Ignavibacteriaceae bacterium]HRP93564.1 MBL fold metallo-hydrolase [Ignavibacteriaceae bacterium]
MIQIQKFTFNLFSENTFVIWDDESKECAIVDPGCSDVNEENELADFISEKKLSVKYLINTHCHIDHILGCEFVKQKYNPVYYAPELDVPLIENAKMQAEMVGMDFSISILPDKYLTEEEELIIGKSKLKFLFTPGHTPGEFCIYIPEIKACITGDVLFYDSIGRTDLWGGNYDTLIKSINEKLLTLPDETVIFPGHGEQSTIGRERKFNPFLQ